MEIVSADKQVPRALLSRTIRNVGVATAILFVLGTESVVAQSEFNGWVIDWNATTTGEFTESDGCVGLLPNGDCQRINNWMSISGHSSGRYVVLNGSTILSGQSEGSSLTEMHLHSNGVCIVPPVDYQTVENYYDFVSVHTHSITGPKPGGSGTIFETTDYDGSPIVQFNFRYGGSCAGEFVETTTGIFSSDCEPYEYTTITPYVVEENCSEWSLTGGAAGTGSPDDESHLSYSGSQIFAGEVLAGNFYTVTSIPYTSTLTMTATKIPLPVIHGIELTQAIQVYQTLDDFAATLSANGGKPPIPIVADKPLAIRVVLDQPLVTVNAIIEVSWNDTNLGSRRLTQLPSCVPPDTTKVNKNKSTLDGYDGCETADFIVGGRPEDEDLPVVKQGDNQLVVRLYSDDPLIGNELLNEYEFNINASETDGVMLGAVNVCAARIGGRWQCLATPVRDLLDGTVLMRKIYPTDNVVVVPTGQQVRLEIIDDAMVTDPEAPDGDQWDCYDSRGRKIINGTEYDDLEDLDVEDYMKGPALKCEKDMWWYIALVRINRLYTIADKWIEASGFRKFYYGLVKSNDLMEWGGMAWDVGEGNAAIGYAPGGIITREYVRDTVPHEIGHLLGLSDLQNDSDTEAVIVQECSAWDPTGTVASPELYLFSEYKNVVKREVPFDVSRSKAIELLKRHDVMGYCPGRVWASPYAYEELFKELRWTEGGGETGQKALVPASGAVDFPTAPVGIAGEFWLVSGFVVEDGAFLDTIFAFETIGPADSGSGSHQLEVLDQAGTVLFTRNFTPATAVPKIIPAGGLPQLPPFFVELVPVQSSAATIVIRDPAGSIIAEESMAGVAPRVTLSFPIGGEQISGEQTLTWTATDDDSDPENLVYWVQYSGDAGVTWMTLAQGLQETSLVVDFDGLPGAPGTAMVRVLASDQVNTGSVTSNLFTVSKKPPAADILVPENGVVVPLGAVVFLEGYGYDLDDGVLPSVDHHWSSDRDGNIGVGYKVSSSTLSEGKHNIRLSVNDSDDNTAVAEVQVFIGESADEDGDGVADEFDQCPGTPAGETVDANGCAASQLDDDGDGISNVDDQCPATPVGEVADNNGCSASQRDSDGDGVSDALDQCPATPAGAAVNSNGCEPSKPSGGNSSGGGGGGGSMGLMGLLALLLVAGRRASGVTREA